MDNEFAIGILEQYREKPTLINEIQTVEEAVWLDEALGMAISLLKQTPCDTYTEGYFKGYDDGLERKLEEPCEVAQMSLDDAIVHAEEVANGKCDKCGQEHKQLAEWLKELKTLKEQDSCKDAISREAVLSLWGLRLSDKEIYTAIHDMEPVTSSKRKGYWKKLGKGYECSLCGCAAPHTEFADCIQWKLSKYCPDCGAEMKNEAMQAST